MAAADSWFLHRTCGGDVFGVHVEAEAPTWRGAGVGRWAAGATTPTAAPRALWRPATSADEADDGGDGLTLAGGGEQLVSAPNVGVMCLASTWRRRSPRGGVRGHARRSPPPQVFNT